MPWDHIMTTGTIQMTMDEALLEAVDEATRELHMSRSALIRAAPDEYLRQTRRRRLERPHAEGCARVPQVAEELEAWDSEQVWAKP
jgi:metal-responsive CopG/Arc/MetJ family transcriptional regulator